MTLPKISVVVPVYNVEKYLKKCLDSILNQTYKNLEIICVYDDSNDSTVEIAKEYVKKDSRIKLIKNEEIFVGGARNTGLKLAAGEFVTFVDSDDWLEPDVYEKAIAAFENHPEAELVVWQADERDKDNNITIENYFKYSYKGTTPFDNSTILSVLDVVWNKMYKKSILDKYRMTFPEGTINEDTCFWWKYASVISKAYFIDNILYHKLSRGDNITTLQCDKDKRCNSFFVITDDLYSFYKTNGILKKNLKTFAYFVCSLLRNDNITDSKEKYAFFDKISDYIKSKTELSEFNHTFIKNMLDKRYDKIPELEINSPKDKIFSYKKGIIKSVLYLFGIKITKKLD